MCAWLHFCLGKQLSRECGMVAFGGIATISRRWRRCRSPSALRRASHRTITAVNDDLDTFHFNRAVARIYELANELGGAANGAGEHSDEHVANWAWREGLEILVRLAGPMMPHLAEEVWQRLGHDRSLADEPWPTADPELIRAERVTIAVQVNGKVRGQLEVMPDENEETVTASALALENVQRAIAGKPVRKKIVVPNRIVNVVV